MSDFVVYTAITNGYDSLKTPPAQWSNEAEFIAFLDEPNLRSGWKFRKIYRRFNDQCRNAKIHKILAHKYFPQAKYSLWIDGSVFIKSKLPPHSWVNSYLNRHDLAVFKHHARSCIYQEALACIQLGLDSDKVINRQMKRYFAKGYPVNNGLAECTVLLRRHTEKVKAFNELWYREIIKGSRRDQLSFNYTAHKLGLKYQQIPGVIYNNPHFLQTKHWGV
jgi:hypothetical protein